jgi:2-octaprenyl-6-methoxyphenol hydroxylase
MYSISATPISVAIAGGGLSGGLLALALLRHTSQSVLLCEKNTRDFFEQRWCAEGASFDDRALALSWSSIVFFRELGIWHDLIPYAEAIGQVEVSEKGRWGVTRLDTSGLPCDALGYVIEIRALLRVIYQHLDQYALQGRWISLWGEGLSNLELGEKNVQFSVKEQAYCAALLVVAEGIEGGLCQQLGISYTEHAYHETALYMNVVCAKPKKNTAFERFLPSEVLALLPMTQLPMTQLPMTQNRYSLVWTFPDAHLSEIQAYDDNALKQQLLSRFGGRMGDWLSIGKRQFFPLVKRVALEQVRHRVVILGNAAHTIHPVAAQGLNLTVRDIKELVRYCVTSFGSTEKSSDFGCFADLWAYEQQRQQDQSRVIHSTGFIRGIFQADFFLLSLMRSKGLWLLESMPSVKQKFTSIAMKGG